MGRGGGGGGFLRHYIDHTDKKRLKRKRKVKPPDFELLGVGSSAFMCLYASSFRREFPVRAPTEIRDVLRSSDIPGLY